MKTFICYTCWKAGRTVKVETETVPTESEVHKAHKGFGLGLGNHNVRVMVELHKD